MCAVELKTVHRLQYVAAQRAELHHGQAVREVAVPGMPLDEAHAKLCPRQVAWLHTALAMGSWFLLWVDSGPHTQEHAATLVAQVVARVREGPLLLTDGWKAYRPALLPVVGIVYRRRRRGKVGRKPTPRLVAPKHLFYAQVVKVRNPAGHSVEVSRRVLCGGPRRFGKMHIPFVLLPLVGEGWDGGRSEEGFSVPCAPLSPPPSPSPIKGEGIEERESFPKIALRTYPNRLM